MYDFNKKRKSEGGCYSDNSGYSSDACDNICVKSCIAFLEIWKKYDNMIKGSKGIIDACLHAIRCIP